MVQKKKKDEAAARLGSKGGKATARLYDHDTLAKWGRLGNEVKRKLAKEKSTDER